MSTEQILNLLRVNIKVIPSELADEVIYGTAGFLHPFPLAILMEHLACLWIPMCGVGAVSVALVAMEVYNQTILR